MKGCLNVRGDDYPSSGRVVHAILVGREPEGFSLRKLMAVKSLGWAEQEAEVGMAG